MILLNFLIQPFRAMRSDPRQSYFTADTYANEHSARAARLAAGLCADLASAIFSGRAKNGFALVRPPGHHAGVSQSMSFFLHNNAAVAALAAQAAGAKKVLIVDWDVHHGNGTQKIFEQNKSVLYISLHRHEGGRFYPGSTGAANEVALTGNFKEAKPLLRDESDDHLSMLCTTITEVDETILHVVTRARQVGFVEEIIKLMEPEDLKLQDRNGNNAFCFATAAGSIEIVKLMLDKNLDLLTLRGADNKVPLYMVALFGRTEMTNFLYDGTESQLTDQDEDAKSGNFELLADLVRSYHDLVHLLDEQERNIFHIAILHRHTDIFNLIYGIGFDKELLATYKDNEKNTMLHLAAKYTNPPQVSNLPGPALEMQQELLMFELSKGMRIGKYHTTIALELGYLRHGWLLATHVP
ncbi:hypothetical protein Q3G72_020851 [Acer saccharum]|nr:hypothetical protein Q3G72_020851 [Acer saccharum]